MLQQFRRLLKVSGRLLLSCPNAEDVSRIGRPWIGFRVDLEHLNYFNVATISALLERHDLFVACYWETSQPAIFNGSLSFAQKVARKLNASPMQQRVTNATRQVCVGCACYQVSRVTLARAGPPHLTPRETSPHILKRGQRLSAARVKATMDRVAHTRRHSTESAYPRAATTERG